MPSLVKPVSSVGRDHFYDLSISDLSPNLAAADDRNGTRAKALKQIVRVMEDTMLGQSPNVPGTIPACKMLNLLQASGISGAARIDASEFTLRAELCTALDTLAQEGPNAQVLSAALGKLADGLDWYSGKGGAFASVNFESGHAHAVLGGPKTLHQGDIVYLGVTVMAPYTRFPDHVHRFPRVMFPLSKGDYVSIQGEWTQGKMSHPIVCAAGRLFAMRCGSQPLLALWCQRLAI